MFLSEKIQFSVSFKKFSIVTCSIPLIATVFCVIYSTIYNFYDTVIIFDGICNTTNYLPIISSAIGYSDPQITVWHSCIFPYIALRIIALWAILSCYTQKKIGDKEKKNLKLAVVSSFFELFGIFGLSYYDGYRYCKQYYVHKKFIHLNC
jgi:post-GPI attachment to proteins factor 2